MPLQIQMKMLQKYQLDGTKIGDFGVNFESASSHQLEKLKYPKAFAVDNDGNILILDAGHMKLKILDQRNRFHALSTSLKKIKSFAISAVWIPEHGFCVLYQSSPKADLLNTGTLVRLDKSRR